MTQKSGLLLDRLADVAMGFFQPEEGPGDVAWDHQRETILVKFAAVMVDALKEG